MLNKFYFLQQFIAERTLNKKIKNGKNDRWEQNWRHNKIIKFGKKYGRLGGKQLEAEQETKIWKKKHKIRGEKQLGGIIQK